MFKALILSGIGIFCLCPNLILSFPDIPCNDENSGKFISDPESCEYYYACLAKVWYKLTCPQTLVFNPIRELCDRPINGGCNFESTQAPSTESTEEQTTEVPISTETSTEEVTTTEIHTTSEEIVTTSESSSSMQTETETETEEVTTIESSSTESLSSVQSTTEGSESNACTGKPPKSFVPHPEDCSAFYYCNDNGTPSLFKCGVGLLFDAKELKCKYENEAVCFG
uniref:CSON015602 protein n=1 Tax=Culicoides sonorensis TaxID=179676 RepID=A0A336LPM8_CULSO